MKVLLAISNTLLSIFLIVSGVTFVMGRVTEAKYLQTAAEKSGIYSGVSQVVSEQLSSTVANNLGVPQPTVNEKAAVISEKYIQEKGSEISNQLEQVLSGESEKLSLNFSDLAAEAQANGLKVNPTDFQPIEIAIPKNVSDSTVRTAQNLDLLRFVSYILTIVFFSLSLILSIIKRSFLGLGLAFLSAAITFGVFGLLAHLLKPALSALVVLPDNIAKLNTFADTFIKTLLSDISKHYLMFMVSLLIAAVTCMVLHKILKPARIKLAQAQAPPITTPPQSSSPH